MACAFGMCALHAICCIMQKCTMTRTRHLLRGEGTIEGAQLLILYLMSTNG
jgi:hypothetical protein